MNEDINKSGIFSDSSLSVRLPADYLIRPARLSDAEQILEVYSPYITNTRVTFETVIPSPEAFRERMSGIMKDYPYLICQLNERVVGYAYASAHGTRAAYQFSVDLSIYLAPEHHRKGLGRQLYQLLFSLLAARGFYTAYAAISAPNPDSVAMHQALGFQTVGQMHKVGYKLGKWCDLLWMERPLRSYDEDPLKFAN